MTTPNKEEQIFHGALEIDSARRRAAYIQRECAGNRAMLERIRTLLWEHEAAGLLDEPPSGVESPLIDLTSESSSQFGPYKLLQQLGEGGFGVVYMAQQQDPVRRNVALKIIKPGMDTKEVIARFVAERQALALMDHPNIARVFDAGETDQGRPYFVMELVKGVPLTEFCDENQLSNRDRLELFVTICRALQHAHQKGVIHQRHRHPRMG